MLLVTVTWSGGFYIKIIANNFPKLKRKKLLITAKYDSKLFINYISFYVCYNVFWFFFADLHSPVPGGPGDMGKGYAMKKESLTAEERKLYDEGMAKNSFNEYLSDMMALRRRLPDMRNAEYVSVFNVLPVSKTRC